ncbi:MULTISPECIES: nucleotide sugar dehydrogenase [Prochlorococcus]|uniref:nucleotide sugar dehydrogenase n=1 Tax=Prochlorococcus TaxID=1218 RepID=UPI0005337284|nr:MULTISPECIES: nucleotide sugar dehydrogenase [Prochlorococcus]KGG13048.1 UDP-glucose dehydrogenase [Prochlorococcus sp. MIT 0601]
MIEPISNTKIQNICCIGAGYVGGPTMAVIADRCPSIQVKVVDINQARIDAWNSSDLSKLPVYEPGLDLVISRARNRNLFFSINVEDAIAQADMVFISVNTPTKTKGLGAGKASDLRWVEACARQVAKFAKQHTIVVEKSTLPVRTAEVIKTILEAAQSSLGNILNPSTFDVLSNPEFLAEGSAIKDLENPDRVLIGGESKQAIESLAWIYKHWVAEEKILRTNIWSSELAKLTANAFLAQRISSINSIGALCEATGADVREVARAIGTDSRIGSKFLDAGPGFGGSCFKKDILNLVYLSRHFGLPEVADFWEGVVELNTWHQHRISRLVVKKLFGTLSGKRIALLGFSFKANTNDTRESSAINIAKDLLDEGALLSIHDPKVSPSQIERDLGQARANLKNIELNKNSMEGIWWFSEDIYEVCSAADAVLILTEWHQYSEIDWPLVATKMRNPAWVFDARSIINSEKVLSAGLQFWRVGDGSELDS